MDNSPLELIGVSHGLSTKSRTRTIDKIPYPIPSPFISKSKKMSAKYVNISNRYNMDIDEIIRNPNSNIKQYAKEYYEKTRISTARKHSSIDGCNF